MKTITSIAACILFMSAVTVHACPSLGSVTLAPDGYGAKGTAHITGGGHSNHNTYAGLMKFNVVNATGDDNPFTAGTTIGVFCCELTQLAAKDEASYNIILPEQGTVSVSHISKSIGSDKAALLSELWGRFYDESWLTSSSYTQEQKNAAEAFQLCIWEILYENNTTLDISVDSTCGDFGFSASTNIELANGMLAALDGTGEMAELVIVSNSSSQDFITAIPEPATIAILGAGFILLRSRRRAA